MGLSNFEQNFEKKNLFDHTLLCIDDNTDTTTANNEILISFQKRKKFYNPAYKYNFVSVLIVGI